MGKTYLIADAGSTKTEWWIDGKTVSTLGINPVTMKEEDILKNIPEGLPQTDEIHFYGAGCTPEKSQVVRSILEKRFPEAEVSVASDLLGAARALCGKNPGIACILGTGSNSCLYDGEKIIQNTPALGFILGDEGSGAVLGKLFLNALLKGRIPKEIRDDFERSFCLSTAEIIDKVYRQPAPNRFLASFSHFISQHKDNVAVAEIIRKNFSDFFDNNIKPYETNSQINLATKPQINFVGSIAHHYQEILKAVAKEKDYSVGKIIQSPLPDLVAFHTT